MHVPKRAFVTAVTRDYLHQARVLARSLRRVHPTIDFWVCLVDRPLAPLSDAPELSRCFLASELGIPRWRRFTFQYTPFELSVALKPHALSHLFTLGYDEVVYLDSDIEVFAPLDGVFTRLRDANLVLTPHFVAASAPDAERERRVLRAGVHNAGFIALRRGEVAAAFLSWWSARCASSCVVDLAGGFFTDQRWLDLAPGIFPGVAIERHAGMNVGHWRLPGARLRRGDDGQLRVDGEPLVFFHFSGFSPANPLQVSRHDPGLSFDELPVLRELSVEWSSALSACGASVYARWGCEYAALSDGTPIHARWREAVRLGVPSLAGIEDPFDTARTRGLEEKLERAASRLPAERSDWVLAGGGPKRGPLRKLGRRAAKAWRRFSGRQNA